MAQLKDKHRRGDASRSVSYARKPGVRREHERGASKPSYTVAMLRDVVIRIHHPIDPQTGGSAIRIEVTQPDRGAPGRDHISDEMWDLYDLERKKYQESMSG